jgi:general secretion pathway protein L
MGPGEALEAIGCLDEELEDSTTSANERSRHVLLYCDTETHDQIADEIESLRTRVDSYDVRQLPGGPLARLAVTVGAGAGVNLLQGVYGPKTEYAGYLLPWRYAAAALLALGLVAIVGTAIGNMQLARQEAALMDAFLEEYQQIAPGATEVRDPVSIISSLRSRAGVAGSGPSVFLQSLEHLSVAVAENSASDIQAISYRAGVVDVRLTAPDVSTLDDIQRRIDDQGVFDANIQSTDQDDERVNSRIQIREAGR